MPQNTININLGNTTCEDDRCLCSFTSSHNRLSKASEVDFIFAGVAQKPRDLASSTMVSSSFLGTWRIALSYAAMCASILASVSAQGMATDFERMEKYAQRVEGACIQPTVSPHWLPSNDSFWYRRDTGK